MDSFSNRLQSSKKIGVICCEDAIKWGAEDGCARLMVDLLSKEISIPLETFQPILGITGKLPSIDELSQFAGFVISGSHYSVNQNADWMLRLEEFVRNCKNFYDTAESKGDVSNVPRIVGLCFGHQIICKALGGIVGKNPSGRFVICTESIEPTEEFLDKTYSKSLNGNRVKGFNVLQSHGESLLSLPSCANVLASSKTCEYEIVQYGNGVLGVQGHPEMPLDMLKEKILSVLKSANVITEEEEKSTIESFKLETHGKEVLHALFNFICA